MSPSDAMSLAAPPRAPAARAPDAARTFAVLGAGHAGFALAGHLALRGFSARLWNRTAEALGPVQAAGGLWLDRTSRRGGSHARAFAPVELATDDLASAVRGAGAVLVATTATAHRDLARALAPHLSAGQLVVLNPGRTGGALEFRAELLRAGGPEALVAEAETLAFACRRGPGAEVTLHGLKRRVRLAAFPARRTAEALHRLRPAFPQFRPAEHVLATGFANLGAVFHPAPLLLNLGRAEAGLSFEHYTDGVTESVGRVMERLDAERVAVARAFGVRTPTALEWLRLTYGTPRPADGRLRTALRATSAYAGIPAPGSWDARYLTEDVPTGLVPLSELGRLARVPTPVADALIALASAVAGRDFRREGRTLARLGLAGRRPAEIVRFVVEGGWAG